MDDLLITNSLCRRRFARANHYCPAHNAYGANPERAKSIWFSSAYTAGQVDVLVTGNTVAAKVSEDKPDLNLETKFIIKESPAFMGVKAGESNIPIYRLCKTIHRT